MTRWQADYTKFLPSWKEFPLGGFLGVLGVLAVNAELKFDRQVAKDAKKTNKQNNLVAAEQRREDRFTFSLLHSLCLR